MTKLTLTHMTKDRGAASGVAAFVRAAALVS
jgi:hypothetical protein